MNKKGFTLIEILVVIALLGLLLSLVVVEVTKLGTKAKEKTLLTKIRNIEKAAILYGQDYNGEWNKTCNINGSDYSCIVINVSNLINDSDSGKSYISGDNNTTNIVNPLYNDEYLNNCKIHIYKKYGKIYATYTKESDNSDDKCWK